MIFAGFKFGIGFAAGTLAFTALFLLVVFAAGCVSDYFAKQKAFLKLHWTKSGNLLWARETKSVQRKDSTLQRFSFRTTIRWDDREKQMEQRKETHYRH